MFRGVVSGAFGNISFLLALNSIGLGRLISARTAHRRSKGLWSLSLVGLRVSDYLVGLSSSAS